MSKKFNQAKEDTINCIIRYLYQKLWESIRDYLQVHNLRVASIPNNTTLITLKKNVQDVQIIMATIYKLFVGTHCLPLGGPLLTYLFQVCLNLRQTFVKKIILSFVYDCCSAYISKVLQVWIFDGVLPITSNIDFFVCINSNLTKDRMYYNNIVKIPDLIPMFLDSLSDRILACGRAVHLLHLFGSDNKFDHILRLKKYPAMSLCFNDHTTEKLLKEFSTFEDNVYDLMGERVTFAKIWESDRRDAEDRETKIKELLNEMVAKREKERAVMLENKIKEKRQKSELLREQIEANAKLREERKRKELEIDRKLQEEIEKIRVREVQREEEGKRILREHYKSLLNTAEKKKAEAEWNEKRINHASKRLDFVNEDAVNDNNLLDQEGNIINPENSIEDVAKREDANRNIANVNERIADAQNLDEANRNYEIAHFEAEKNRERVLSSNYAAVCPLESYGKELSNKCNIEQGGELLETNVSGEDKNASKMMYANIISLTYKMCACANETEPNDDEVKVLDTNKNDNEEEMEICKCSCKEKDKGLKIKKECEILKEAVKNKMRVLGTVLDNNLEASSLTEYNVSSHKVLTEAMKNKLKILGTDYNINESPPKSPKSPVILTEAMKNKIKIMGGELEISGDCKEITKPDEGPREITEAMKNKFRVLGTEFNREPDVKSAEHTSPKIMTEALRNKLKILGTEYEREESGITPKKAKESLAILTEAMKNKLRVLGTEYNLEPEIAKPLENSNPVIMTEALRNKIKILGSEYQREQLEMTPQKLKECPKVLTEAMKNKLKVLGMQYDIIANDEDNMKTNEKVPKVLTEAMKNKIKVLGSEYAKVFENNDEKIEEKSRKAENNMKSDKINLLNSLQFQEIDAEQKTKLAKTCDGIKSEIDFEFKTAKKEPLLAFSRLLLLPKTAESVWLDSKVEETKDFAQITAEDFEQYFKKSIDIAVSTQERLINGEILKNFLLKEKLMSHLLSLRSFFLLQDGEFAHSLTAGISESLTVNKTPKSFFDAGNLSNILNEALASTIQLAQLNSDLVSFQIVNMPKTLKLDKCDLLMPFQLSYNVSWPMNIVIPPGAISKYRQVFNLFFCLKRLHWCFNESFSHLVTQSKDKNLNGILLRNSPHYTKLAVYRHAMTVFIIALQEHLSTSGPHAAWDSLIQDMKRVENLDDIYQAHVRYIRDITKRAFLAAGSDNLLSYIHELVECGLKFYYLLKCSSWELMDNKCYKLTNYENLRRLFINFCGITKKFQKCLRKKLERHQELKRLHLPLLELIETKISIG